MRLPSYPIVAISLFALLTIWAPSLTFAAGGLPLSAGFNRTLVGNPAGSVDNYPFTVPPDAAAAKVYVYFSPGYVADGSRAGFTVSVNGATVGTGQQDPTTPGLLTYTMPHSPSGVAIVQVFSYVGGFPVGYTLYANTTLSDAAESTVTDTSLSAPARLRGKSHGTLVANSGGTAAYFTFATPGSSPPVTITMTYSPADARVEQAVGFTVIDAYQNHVYTATQPKGQNFSSATLTLDIARPVGEALTLQVFNYSADITITYTISVTGIASSPQPIAAGQAGSSGAANSGSGTVAFQPFWVENFVATDLWSGIDSNAISFGVQPQFSSFLVVAPQTGGRLYVLAPTTHNYAYIDANAVGPSGPPT